MKQRPLLAAIILSVLLIITLLGAIASFLYVILFGGPWTPLLWTVGVSFGLVMVIKFVAFARFNDKTQLIFASMLWELLGGVTGWTWMILAVSSFVLFIRAIFFGGTWRAFFVCLVASVTCKALTRYTLIWQEGTMFKRGLVEKGMSLEEARRAWIAEARRRLKEE